jgi:hypothetical protein
MEDGLKRYVTSYGAYMIEDLIKGEIEKWS